MSIPNKKKQLIKSSSKTSLDGFVGGHGNDPVFVKRTAESKAFLDKVGFPKELGTIKKKRNSIKSNKAVTGGQTPDLGNHPYFVKKAAEAKAALKKSGFPSELVPKKK